MWLVGLAGWMAELVSLHGVVAEIECVHESRRVSLLKQRKVTSTTLSFFVLIRSINCLSLLALDKTTVSVVFH